MMSKSDCKTIILNGSPKGPKSISLQYTRYILNLHNNSPNVQEIHIAQQLHLFEKNEEKWTLLLNMIKDADVIIWAFPVYYMLIHSNYKRFIELIFEKNASSYFSDKMAASVSTSIHFFDHTAHNYIHAISEDLRMNFLGYGSFHMNDLRNKNGRNKVDSFSHYLFKQIQNHQYPPPRYFSHEIQIPAINLDEIPRNYPVLNNPLIKITIVTDMRSNDHNLIKMVRYFQQIFAEPPSLVNLWDIQIKGPCLGCLECGYNNTCRYQNHDEYYAVVEEYIKSADILIFAGSIQDRYLSARWKLFFDRFFYNGHVPSLINKYIGYCIAGNLALNENLQEILLSIARMHKMIPIGFVSDQILTSGDKTDILEGNIYNLAANLITAYHTGLEGTDFREIGGKLLFRDEIFGGLNMVFRADHRKYRKLRIYKSFPQKKRLIRFISAFVRLLRHNKHFRSSMDAKMIDYMVQPYYKFSHFSS